MKMKIRKGDRVRVMRGDEADKNKVGEVIRVLPKENRVVVQGVNIVKKHQKQTQSGGKTIPAGIREFEAPVDLSNVALVDRAAEKEAKVSRRSSKAKSAEDAKAEKKTSRRKSTTAPKTEKAKTSKKSEDKGN
ncbi:MAG: 50S ribosomal protein L24 [Anaerolineaceae bacterium]|nr:50S ribosomal protein L24 [Anaerolineaceae bacterium]MDD4578822.1 50S ribosomal protein L24 [Anaerolineaceae bacterium]